MRISGKTYLCLLVQLVVLTACEHKELMYGSPLEVKVNYDWSLCPDAAPKAMRLVAFMDGKQPEPYPSEGRNSFSIVIPTGYYSFIAHNSDTEMLDFGGDTWSDYEIKMIETQAANMASMFAPLRRVPMALGTENQKIGREPDKTWYGVSSNVDLTDGEGRAITLSIQEATQDYVFEMHNIRKLEDIANIVVTISGVSLSFIPSLGRCSDTHGVVSLTGCVADEHCIRAMGHLFGHCPSGETFPHMLTLYVQLNDGTQWYYTADVTEAMHRGSPPSGGGATQIVVEDMFEPKPITNGSGLHPSLEDWKEEEVNVPL